MAAIKNQGEANQLLQRIYGSASRAHKRAAVDSGLIYILVNEASDREKIANKGQTIKAER